MRIDQKLLSFYRIPFTNKPSSFCNQEEEILEGKRVTSVVAGLVMVMAAGSLQAKPWITAYVGDWIDRSNEYVEKNSSKYDME